MDEAPKVMKVLVINVGVDPIKTEKFEFPITEKELARTTVLSVMNRMGKNSEAIAKVGDGPLVMYSHTSARGPSKELYRSKINYHPLSGELA